MPVTVLGPESERRRLRDMLRPALGVPVHSAGPDEIDGVLARRALRVAVVCHAGGFDGLSAALEIVRCRPDAATALVAHGGDEMLAAAALKAGVADYIPASRVDCLPDAVKRLLHAAPRVAVEQTLRDTEESLRLALRAARIGVWEWDLISGRGRAVAAAEAFGLPPAECDFPAGMGLVHADDREAVRLRLALIIQGRDSFPLECRLASPDAARPLWAYVTGSVERAAGRAVFARGVLMDVTRTREADARIVRARRLEALGLLAGGIAHDLNNVLTPIQLAVDLLRYQRDDSQRDALLGTVSASVERGVRLLRQVLDFARGQDLDHRPVRLAELIAAARLQLTPALPAGVTLDAWAAPGLPAVRGDAAQLSQAIANLAANAVEAMPAGGTVTLRAEAVAVSDAEARSHPGASAGPHVLLTVADQGEGIPAGVIDRVFDPFFSTKQANRHPGLGLSVVRGIVRRHGGFLDIESGPGRGTRLRVWLPALTGAGDGQALVLLADGAPESCRAGRDALEEAGFRVVTASNGPEALLAHDRHRGELALAAVAAGLPILDGHATLRALRQAEPTLPLVLLADGRPTADAGPLAGWVPQPYVPARLVEAARDALGRV